MLVRQLSGRVGTASILVLVLVAMSLGAATWARGEESIGQWDADGVEVGLWVQDPVSGFWTDMPVAVPENPYIYRSTPACSSSEEPGYSASCATQVPSCTVEDATDAEVAMAVVWERSLKSVKPPVWERVGDYSCVYSSKPKTVLKRIGGRIVREFRRLPVVAGELGLQPSPHTLRGAHTNIYAASRVQVFDVGLLGQDVRIEARPVAYRWSYGDGTSLGPVSASGGPLPAGRWGERTATSHVYRATGDFPVILTVTFEGTYSVNGGPAVPIPGTGEFSAPPRTISVWRSETRNYADDCNANPVGAGC